MEAPLPVDEAARLETLNDLNLLDTPIEERFERITRLVSRTLNVPIANFTLIDGLRQWFKSSQGMTDVEGPRTASFCAHTIVEQSGFLLVTDVKKDRRFVDNPLVTGRPNIGFYVGCTVHAPNGLKIGTLCAADTKPRFMSRDEVETLRDLAAIVETELRAIALSKAQDDLITELDATKRLALIDPLTRLWNRGGAEELLNREWIMATRKKTPLAIAMVDIDHFKKVNDTHGHPVGDEVIQTTAKRLLSSLRGGDAIGRWGGEEFMIIMPSCHQDALPDILERIRLSLASEPVMTTTGPLGITASLGAVIVTPEKGDSLEAMIKRADDALYISKRDGRNRSSVSPPPSDHG